MPTQGDVTRRTRFIERIVKDGSERIFFKPFYLVSFAGISGALNKLWEPMDKVRNSMIQTFDDKEVHLTVEWDAKAGLLECERKPDGLPMQLHSFGGCDWTP